MEKQQVCPSICSSVDMHETASESTAASVVETVLKPLIRHANFMRSGDSRRSRPVLISLIPTQIGGDASAMPPRPILSRSEKIHHRSGSSPSIHTPKSLSRFAHYNLPMLLHPTTRISTRSRSDPSTFPRGRAYVLRCRYHSPPESLSTRALSFWTSSPGKVPTSFSQTSAFVVDCWRCVKSLRSPKRTT